MNQNTSEWQKCDIQTFWDTQVAACSHLVQIYDSEEVLINSLLGFVSTGLRAGESVIIIAVPDHIHALDHQLKGLGFDIDKLKSTDQYIPLDAHTILASFMSVGWPNRTLFFDTVEGIIERAKGKNNRKVRAYGEMVAIIWGQGFSGATVQLEHLWTEVCQSEDLCLYCAYPKSGFTQDVHKSIGHICSTHSKVISGDQRSEDVVIYKLAN